MSTDMVDVEDDALSAVNDRIEESTYVRLCAGVAVLKEPDRVLVASSLGRKLLTGGDAQRIATTLIPLLDGRHTVAEACAMSGMSKAATTQAISLLRSFGLVEYSESSLGDVGSMSRHAFALFSQVTSSAGHRNSQETADALAGSAVLIEAPGPVAEPLRDDLMACGISSVSIADPADGECMAVAVARTAQAVYPLVIGVELPGGGPLSPQLAALCRERRVKFLRAARNGSVAELGPLFFPGYTACYDCFIRSYREYFNGDTSGQRAPGAPGDSGDHVLDNVLAAMIADEALAVLGHIRVPRSYRNMTLVSLSDYSDKHLTVVPYPDCPVCGALYACAEEASPAAAYEWQVHAMPKEFGSPGPAKSAVADLVSMRASFPSSPSYPLPAAARLPACQQGSPEAERVPAFDLTGLAAVLARTAGRRLPGHPSDFRRWAPSGGNLASVRAYVVAEGAGFGEASEILLVYDDIEHRLKAARACRMHISRLLSGTGLRASSPSAAIVFVVDVARVARKYGSFAYRLSHLDTGVAAAQLAAVIQELDLTVTFAPSWSPELAEILELLPEREYVSGLALISQGDRPSDAAYC